MVENSPSLTKVPTTVGGRMKGYLVILEDSGKRLELTAKVMKDETLYNVRKETRSPMILFIN